MMFNKNFSFFWKKYKFRSIVVKNSLMLFVIFSLILVIPMSGIYILIINDARDSITEENLTANKKISATVEALMRDMEYLAGEMLSDSDMSYYMTIGENVAYTDKEKLINKIYAYRSGKRLIDSIYVYSERNRYICTDNQFEILDDFGDLSWLEEYNKEFEENCKVIVRKKDDTGKKVFSMMKKYVNKRSGIIINIDPGQLHKYVRELFYNGDEFYIVNENDILYTNVITNRRDSDIEKKITEMVRGGKVSDNVKINNKMISIVAEKSPYYDWNYVRICDSEQNENNISRLFYIMLAVLLLLMLIIIVCSMLLSLNNVSHITVLLNLFDNKEINKNLTENEISEIANKIIVIIDDNEKLKKEIQIKNNEYDKMTMKALQMQITPHFLNNTLAAINFEAIESFNGENRISAMISKLSKILEYTLVSEKILVPLREETDYIKNYIEILKIRYGNFQMDFDIDDEVNEIMVLRMCIQPMIENAVFHGIKKKGGKITLRCKKSECGVKITIEDNGSGISEGKIKQIMESFENDMVDDENVGLKNVYRRLKIIFADRFAFSIDSRFGEYTRIILEIPNDSEQF